MNDVFLLLGSNLNDRENHILQAIESIDHIIGRVVCTSRMYETQAWGNEDQHAFINMAIRVISKFRPHRILSEIKKIENSSNRKRTERWGPRSIDIDILFYNHEVIVEENLCIPHKLMHKRKFALIPLYEIAANKIHPAYSKSVATLLQECQDPLEVAELKTSHV